MKDFKPETATIPSEFHNR